MTIIAEFATTVLATLGLLCATFCIAFIALAYTGNGDVIVKVSCAIQTDSVAEYTTCISASGVVTDN